MTAQLTELLALAEKRTHHLTLAGKRLAFELHRWCGPVLLKRNGDPATRQPAAFLEAATRWMKRRKL